MKVFEQKGYTTCCGTPSEWPELKNKWKDETKVSVLDIRTATEFGDEKLEELPEGWLYRRLALLGSIVSEQDIDVFRREQRRHGRLIVIAANETRGSLLALADIARLERTMLPKDELKKLGDTKKEKALIDWLNTYLERHQDPARMGVL